jgi:hypothetical protein
VQQPERIVLSPEARIAQRVRCPLWLRQRGMGAVLDEVPPRTLREMRRVVARLHQDYDKIQYNWAFSARIDHLLHALRVKAHDRDGLRQAQCALDRMISMYGPDAPWPQARDEFLKQEDRKKEKQGDTPRPAGSQASSGSGDPFDSNEAAGPPPASCPRQDSGLGTGGDREADEADPREGVQPTPEPSLEKSSACGNASGGLSKDDRDAPAGDSSAAEGALQEGSSDSAAAQPSVADEHSKASPDGDGAALDGDDGAAAQPAQSEGAQPEDADDDSFEEPATAGGGSTGSFFDGETVESTQGGVSGQQTHDAAGILETRDRLRLRSALRRLAAVVGRRSTRATPRWDAPALVREIVSRRVCLPAARQYEKMPSGVLITTDWSMSCIQVSALLEEAAKDLAGLPGVVVCPTAVSFDDLGGSEGIVVPSRMYGDRAMVRALRRTMDERHAAFDPAGWKPIRAGGISHVLALGDVHGYWAYRAAADAGLTVMWVDPNADTMPVDEDLSGIIYQPADGMQQHADVLVDAIDRAITTLLQQGGRT